MTEQMRHRLRLTAEDLDAVRANLDWQSLFQGLGLQKAEGKSKAEDWWAFSPFHEEATPSFHMGVGGKWYDFSIGEGGGCIELIQKLQNLNCFEAGAYIVEQGWSVVPHRQDRQARASSTKPKQTAVKTKRAVQVLEQSLSSETSENAPIRQDLLPLCVYHEAIQVRGISEATAQELGIGYLAQGRSPLRGRIVFQVRDARPPKKKAVKSKGPKSQTQGQDLAPIILSHLGRAVKEDQQPKYLFYEGFHKSQEILGQDRLWLHPETIEQIKATGTLVLTEGPFDWAKMVEAGLHNVGATMGAVLSESQAQKVKALAAYHRISAIILAFDRDKAGREGAIKAKALLNQLDLDVLIFDWDRIVGRIDGEPAGIPDLIQDVADFSPDQLIWLRGKGWL